MAYDPQAGQIAQAISGLYTYPEAPQGSPGLGLMGQTWNQALGVAEGVSRAAGDFVQFLGDFGEAAATEVDALLDYVAPDIGKYVDAEGAKDAADVARSFGKWISSADFGYKPAVPWSDIQDAIDSGDVLALAKTLPPAFAETLVQSAPEMYMIMRQFFPYMMTQTQRFATQRARNEGRAEANVDDYIKATPFAIAQGLVGRYGTEKLLERAGLGKAARAAQEKRAATLTPKKARGRIKTSGVQFGKGFITEGATETVEGQLEYAGGIYGTGKEWDPAAAQAIALQSVVLGGGAGGLAGGVGGFIVPERATIPPPGTNAPGADTGKTVPPPAATAVPLLEAPIPAGDVTNAAAAIEDFALTPSPIQLPGEQGLSLAPTTSAEGLDFLSRQLELPLGPVQEQVPPNQLALPFEQAPPTGPTGPTPPPTGSVGGPVPAPTPKAKPAAAPTPAAAPVEAIPTTPAPTPKAKPATPPTVPPSPPGPPSAGGGGAAATATPQVEIPITPAAAAPPPRSTAKPAPRPAPPSAPVPERRGSNASALQGVLDMWNDVAGPLAAPPKEGKVRGMTAEQRLTALGPVVSGLVRALDEASPALATKIHSTVQKLVPYSRELPVSEVHEKVTDALAQKTTSATGKTGIHAPQIKRFMAAMKSLLPDLEKEAKAAPVEPGGKGVRVAPGQKGKRAKEISQARSKAEAEAKGPIGPTKKAAPVAEEKMVEVPKTLHNDITAKEAKAGDLMRRVRDLGEEAKRAVEVEAREMHDIAMAAAKFLRSLLHPARSHGGKITEQSMQIVSRGVASLNNTVGRLDLLVRTAETAQQAEAAPEAKITGTSAERVSQPSHNPKSERHRVNAALSVKTGKRRPLGRDLRKAWGVPESKLGADTLLRLMDMAVKIARGDNIDTGILSDEEKDVLESMKTWYRENLAGNWEARAREAVAKESKLSANWVEQLITKEYAPTVLRIVEGIKPIEGKSAATLRSQFVGLLAGAVRDTAKDTELRAFLAGNDLNAAEKDIDLVLDLLGDFRAWGISDLDIGVIEGRRAGERAQELREALMEEGGLTAETREEAMEEAARVEEMMAQVRADQDFMSSLPEEWKNMTDEQRDGFRDMLDEMVRKEAMDRLLANVIESQNAHGEDTDYADLMRGAVEDALDNNDPLKFGIIKNFGTRMVEDYGKEGLYLMDVIRRTGGRLNFRDINNALLMVLPKQSPLKHVLGAVIRSGVEGVSVDFRPHGDPEFGGWMGGFFDTQRRVIYMDANWAYSPSEFVTAYIHEAVHAVTSAKLVLDNALYDEINQYMQSVKADLIKTWRLDDSYLAIAGKLGRKNTPEARLARAQQVERMLENYGFLNPMEFLAVASTDPEFQIQLAAMPSKLPHVRNRWQQFINIIAKFFGLQNTAERAALDDVMTLFDKAVHNEDVAQYVAANIEEIAKTSRHYQFGSKTYPNRQQYQRSLNKFATYTRQHGGAILGKLGDVARDASIDTEYLRSVRKKIHMPHKATRFLLGNSLTDQIASIFKPWFDRENGSNPLADLHNAMVNKQGEAKAFERRNDRLHKNWKVAEKTDGEKVIPGLGKAADVFNQLIERSTIFQVDPSERWASANNAWTREQRSARLRRRAQDEHAQLFDWFKKLPASYQQVYREQLQFHRGMAKTIKEKTIANILNSFDAYEEGLYQRLVSAKTPKEVKEIMDAYEGDDRVGISNGVTAIVKSLAGNGPYFPLKRFGDFVVEASSTEKMTGFASKEEADAERNALEREVVGSKTSKLVEEANGTFSFDWTQRSVEMFNTQNEAQRAVEDYRSQGFETSGPTVRREYDYVNRSAVAAVFESAKRRIKPGSPQAEAAMKVFTDAIVTLLPQHAFRKSLLERRGVTGASTNMRQAFARYVMSAGWAMAELDYGADIAKGLADMRDQTQKIEPRRAVVGSEVYEEMARRVHGDRADRGLFSEVAGKTGFIWHLLSPSFTVLQMTQTWATGLPYLGGRYGFSASTDAMLQAFRDIGKPIWDSIAKTQGGAAAFTTKEGVDLEDAVLSIIHKMRAVDPQLGDALEWLADRGTLEASFSMELNEAARTNTRSDWVKQAMDASRAMPFLAEVTNRAVMGIATYRLARQRYSASNPNATAAEIDAYAKDKAEWAIRKTQFDYSELNRPRIWVKSDLLRAVTMFKVYPLAVYGLFAEQVLNVKNPARQKEGLKTLAGLFIAHAAFAGLGGIMLEPLRALMYALTLMPGADDEEFIDMMRNPEVYLRRMITEGTGEAWLGTGLTHGIPAAFGANMQGRIGLQSLMVRAAQGDNAWDTMTQTVFDSLIGPIFGMHEGIGKAFKYIGEGGDIVKGLTYAAPKLVRDTVNAWWLKEEGMTDWRGNHIASPEKFNDWDFFVKVMGFQPTKEGDYYLARGAKTRITRMYTDERNALMRKWRQADGRGRLDVQKDIAEFNQRLGPEVRQQYRITPKQLYQSLKEQRRRERQTVSGAYYQKGERALARNYAFLGLE